MSLCRRHIRRVCLAATPCLWALALGLPLPARAAEPAPRESSESKAPEPAPAVVYEQKTVLDFSDVTLEGELTRPEGSYLLNRKKARFGSLVQLRADFLPELQKSIDNL